MAFYSSIQQLLTSGTTVIVCKHFSSIQCDLFKMYKVLNIVDYESYNIKWPKQNQKVFSLPEENFQQNEAQGVCQTLCANFCSKILCK